MKNYSKNITVYSAQFLSMCSIFARISMNVMLITLPMFFIFSNILPNETFFLLKWGVIISVSYHICHFSREALLSIKGFLGVLLFLAGFIVAFFNAILLSISFITMLLYFYIYHSGYGLFSVFADYSITENCKLRIKESSYMIFFISFLLVFIGLAIFS